MIDDKIHAHTVIQGLNCIRDFYRFYDLVDLTFLEDHFDLFAGQPVAGHARGGVG